MNAHPYVKLAVEAVCYYLLKGKLLPCPSPLPPRMEFQSGTFVSIKTKANELRGCVGTITPSQKNLAKEIIHNSVNAATRDPRFKPLKIEELDHLLFSVDVLTPLEPVDKVEQLNPKQYGLSIKYKGQQGVLLPDLEGIDTTQKQIELCLKKGNIKKNASYQMYRFEVERYR